jgi:hypothetical protein
MAKRREISAPSNAADQQTVGLTARQQAHRQLDPAGAASQRDNPIGVPRRRGNRPTRNVHEPDEARYPARNTK